MKLFQFKPNSTSEPFSVIKRPEGQVYRVEIIKREPSTSFDGSKANGNRDQEALEANFEVLHAKATKELLESRKTVQQLQERLRKAQEVERTLEFENQRMQILHETISVISWRIQRCIDSVRTSIQVISQQKGEEEWKRQIVHLLSQSVSGLAYSLSQLPRLLQYPISDSKGVRETTPTTENQISTASIPLASVASSLAISQPHMLAFPQGNGGPFTTDAKNRTISTFSLNPFPTFPPTTTHSVITQNQPNSAHIQIPMQSPNSKFERQHSSSPPKATSSQNALVSLSVDIEEVSNWLAQVTEGASHDFVQYRSQEGYNPLHLACLTNRIDIVHFLLNLRYDDVDTEKISDLSHPVGPYSRFIFDENQSSHTGQTPLLRACRHGRFEAVKFLLEDFNKQSRASLEAMELVVYKASTQVATVMTRAGTVVKRIQISSGRPRQVPIDCQEITLRSRAYRNLTVCLTDRDANGDDALLCAAMSGSLDLVSYLVKDLKMDFLNDRSTLGHTALIRAAMNNRLEVVKFLISIGASCSDSDNEGYTPLLCACIHGYYDLVAYLLTQRHSSIRERSKNGNTAFLCTAKGGHFEIAKFLMDYYTEGWFQMMSQRDAKGVTVLFRAAANGRHLFIYQLIHEVIRRAAASAPGEGRTTAPNNPDDPTPLINHMSAYRELSSVLHMSDRDGDTPLHVASSRGHVQTVETLLKLGASTRSRNNLQQTPIILSAMAGKDQCLEILVKYGAYLRERDNEGFTPFLAACENGQLNTIQFILKQLGKANQVQIYLRKKKKKAEHGYQEEEEDDEDEFLNCESLTSLKSDQHDFHHERDAQSRDAKPGICISPHSPHSSQLTSTTISTPIPPSQQSASAKGHPSDTSQILPPSAFIRKSSHGSSNDNTEHQLRSHKEYSTQQADDSISEKMEPKNTDVQAFYQKVTRDRLKNGRSALGCAAKNGHIRVMEFLVDTLRLSIDDVDYNLDTPLICASMNGHLEAIKWLYKKGCNFKLSNIEGHTPLIRASMNGRLETVRWLLIKREDGGGGASLEEKDRSGFTPTICAALHGHLELLKWILTRGPIPSSANPEDPKARYTRLNETTTAGRTPLLCAARNGKIETVKYILSLNQSVRPDLNKVDASGNGLHNAALASNSQELISFVESFIASK